MAKLWTDIYTKINDLLNRRGKGSISVSETFTLMNDIAVKTQAIENLQSYAYPIARSYTSIALMNADAAPTHSVTNKPLIYGNLVNIANPANASDADNGKVYKYLGPGNGFEFFSKIGTALAVNVPVETSELANTALTDLQKLAEYAVNKKTVFNLTNEFGTVYSTDAAAIAAVPSKVRKLGLNIRFVNNSNTWRNLQYIGTDIIDASWTDISKWMDTMLAINHIISSSLFYNQNIANVQKLAEEVDKVQVQTTKKITDFTYKIASYNGATSSSNIITVPIGYTGFDSRLGAIIAEDTFTVKFKVNKTGLTFSFYVSKTDYSSNTALTPTVTDNGDGTTTYTVSGVRPTGQSSYLVWFHQSNNTTKTVAETYAIQSYTGYTYPAISSQVDSALANLNKTVSDFTYKFQNTGGSYNNGSVITVPIGSTGFDSRLGAIITEDTFTVKFKVNKTGLTFSFYVSKTDYSSNVALTPTVTDNGDGTTTYTVSGVRPTGLSSYLVWLHQSNNTTKTVAETYAIQSYAGVIIYNPHVDIKKNSDNISNINSSLQKAIKDYSIYIRLVGGSTSDGSIITVPIGSTGYDSRLGAIIAEDTFTVKFKVNKIGLTFNFYVSKTDSTNPVALTPIVTNNGDGTTTYTVSGARPTGLSSYMVWLHQTNNTAKTDIETYAIQDYTGNSSWNVYESFKALVTKKDTIYGSRKSAGSSSFTQTGVACWFNSAATGYGVISKIRLTATVNGTVTFFVGSIDQWGKMVYRYSFTADFITGDNEIAVNYEIRQGEYLFAKIGDSMIRFLQNTNISAQMMYSNTMSDALQKLSTTYGGSLNFDYTITYDISGYTPKPLYDDLSNQVGAIQAKITMPVTAKAPNGTAFKLKVDNNGNWYSSSNKYKKICFLGNSITKHPITSFWWGEWGMAATEAQYDYVHVLANYAKAKEPTSTFMAYNISSFEQNLTTYDLSLIDAMVSGCDLIVINIGENVSALASVFQPRYAALLDRIISVVPQAELLVGGVFWANNSIDEAMRYETEFRGGTFISKSYLSLDSTNKSSLGSQVTGADGQLHTIDNAGVASHPSNKGMKAIADLLANSLGLI